MSFRLRKIVSFFKLKIAKKVIKKVKNRYYCLIFCIPCPNILYLWHWQFYNVYIFLYCSMVVSGLWFGWFLYVFVKNQQKILETMQQPFIKWFCGSGFIYKTLTKVYNRNLIYCFIKISNCNNIITNCNSVITCLGKWATYTEHSLFMSSMWCNILDFICSW